MDLSGQKQKVFSAERLHQGLITLGLKKYTTVITMAMFMYMIQEILLTIRVRKQI